MFTTIKTIVHNATKPVKIAYNVKCMNKGCYYNTTVTSKPLKKKEELFGVLMCNLVKVVQQMLVMIYNMLSKNRRNCG